VLLHFSRLSGTLYGYSFPTRRCSDHFGRSEMTYQQPAMSRVRAVEHSRTVTVPVTSGVSAIIMPDGTVTQRTGMFVADSLVQEVPLRSSRTPATRLGALPEAALVLAAAGGLGLAVAARVRGRR